MWFFSKKVSIVEDLVGMVDIHNHLLYGVDDGAQTAEHTIEIIKRLKRIGATKCYATPHIYARRYDNKEEDLKRIFNANIVPLAKEHDLDVKLAAEYMITPEFITRLRRRDEFLTLGDGYLLVEMSAFSMLSSNTTDLFDEMQTAGYKPILAHPERYQFCNSRTIRKFKDSGVSMQLNILSLTGGYGKNALNNSLELLDAGLYDFAASDCHRAETLGKLKSLKLPKKRADKLINLIMNTIREFS